MPADDLGKDHAEREKRIEDLKRQAKQFAGGEMFEGQAAKCPPEVTEHFWEYVVAYEKAPWTTHFKQLEESGIALPAPETLQDQELTLKLWEVIRTLAAQRVFLYQTDHLSDRELYSLLWSDILREETKALSVDENSACHIDLLGSGSEEDMQLNLKFYADEETREKWKKDYPDCPVPDHQDPPYDRDSFLPQPDYESPPEPGLEGRN